MPVNNPFYSQIQATNYHRRQNRFEKRGSPLVEIQNVVRSEVRREREHSEREGGHGHASAFEYLHARTVPASLSKVNWVAIFSLLFLLNILAFTNARISVYNWSGSPRTATLPYPSCSKLRACRPSPALDSLGRGLPPFASLGLEIDRPDAPSACQSDSVTFARTANKPTSQLEGYALIRFSNAPNGNYLSFKDSGKTMC